MKDIHIGSIIKQKLRESELSPKEFAELINCDRTTVYDIFKRKSIDVERLIKISQVLNYNFIEEIYFKQNKVTILSQTVYLAFEIDKASLKNIKIQEHFIKLIKE
ncbi:helix-turn-helix domain-containing protein [Bacteroidales bacterium OttesenSCG-928-L03]|nr:helix-turn-helix domain-containing protein [Bacteroidales bacterium OttesenSCG-928-L03]